MSESPAVTPDKESVSSLSGTNAVVSENTYSDSNISVSIKEYREYDTAIYVADIQVSSPEYLKTALAQNMYGINITEKTSDMAVWSNTSH